MNRIYKTVWNRLRRMYVAVNESKRSHSFAKKAAVVATASIAFIANAQTINSSGSISGNYSDLTAEDIRGTIAVEGVIDTDSVAGWEGSLGTHYYTYYWEDPPSWVIETAREYGINELRDEYSWNMDGYVKPIEVSESDLPDINNIRLKVERDRSLVVSGTLNLGTVSQTSQVTVRYIRFVNNGCYDVGGGGTPGCSYTISERTTTRNIDQTGNTELINDGGSITVNNLVFETSENRFIQNSGTSEIERYSGGGLIDLNGGSLTLGNLSSGAVLQSSNAVINAEDINLTASTFTASNTTLNTTLSEIANFRQDIANTDALNLSGNDSKVSFIAFQPLA